MWGLLIALRAAQWRLGQCRGDDSCVPTFSVSPCSLCPLWLSSVGLWLHLSYTRTK